MKDEWPERPTDPPEPNGWRIPDWMRDDDDDTQPQEQEHE